MDIHRRAGAGLVRIGTPAANLKELIGAPRAETAKVRGGPPVLSYDDLGLHVHLDEAGLIREVELFRPSTATLDGEDLLELSREAADALLTRSGCDVEHAADGMDAWTCGIRLWIPDAVVASVVIFDPDDPANSPTTDEILARLGIAPIQR